VRPALQFESLIETIFSLAAGGQTNRKGLPNPLRLAVIARTHFDTVRLPFPPAWVQRAALALGAPLGKTLGYDERRVRDRAQLIRVPLSTSRPAEGRTFPDRVPVSRLCP
jgi:hypothetical protein